MRIPSGDLVPARRRRGRAVPLLLAVLLLAGVAGGGWLLRREDTEAGERLRAARCGQAPLSLRPVSSRGPALPAPGRVRLAVLNGTDRDGLGRSVADALAARGFGVLSTGNAPAAQAGASAVVFGPGGRPAATLLAAHVLGARLVPAPTAPAGSVQLVLGAGFVRLRTPQEVPVALRALTAPPPAPRTTPAPSTPDPQASPC